MAGELGSQPYGLPITLTFSVANPGAAGTVVLLAAQGGVGYKVPAGYKFHPLLLGASTNDAVTAGSGTFSVTDNTVAAPNGPQAVLSSAAGSTLQASGLQRLGASPIAAGHIVGVTVVTNAGWLPVTADVDAVLVGVLIEG